MAFAKINRIFLAATFALLAPHFALAQVVITEIMYDLPLGSDSGREWIEVYNSGPASVDLTKLRLFENGINHKIAGSGTLAPNGYAVIADNPAKFKADWPAFSGQLFDSAFNLGNAGDTIEMRDASSTTLDTASFTSALGAAGDGNTLNRSSAGEVFTPHTPSPGAMMSTSIIPPKEKPAPIPKVVAPKKSFKTTKFASSTGASAATNDPAPEVAASPQAAAAVTAATAPWEWWLAAGLLAFASAGAVVFARKYAKDEWDIVEENDE